MGKVEVVGSHRAVGLYRSGCCSEGKRTRTKVGAGKPLGSRCHSDPQWRGVGSGMKRMDLRGILVLMLLLCFLLGLKNVFFEEVDTLLWLMIFVDLNCV